ncbi:MAG: BLUF domain-containing protein [Pseudomonadota bacterium]
MALHKLIYISRPVVGSNADWDEILAASDRNNARLDITGMLLFDGEHYLQLLEGERRDVSDLFLTIAEDKRHTHVEIITSAPSEFRLFGGWSMQPFSASGLHALLGRQEISRISLRDMAVAEIERICVDFSGLKAAMG